MKLSDGTQNFWSQMRGYALSSALTIAIAFHFYGWKIASIIALFLFVCFIWLLSDIKEKLIRTQPDLFNYETTTIEDYPLLNFNWFQNQTDQLKLLGFVQIMDYKIPQSPGFARCFAHPVNYCYAEVNEVFKATGESLDLLQNQKHVRFISFLSDLKLSDEIRSQSKSISDRI
ncbi:hypothetical protein [Pseudanabaena minima]|uniref:hypothetical protein n=1 Tax=Pseudanabaena minima TaxID=890415 RepID=UPI003DA8E073